MNLFNRRYEKYARSKPWWEFLNPEYFGDLIEKKLDEYTMKGAGAE